MLIAAVIIIVDVIIVASISRYQHQPPKSFLKWPKCKSPQALFVGHISPYLKILCSTFFGIESFVCISFQYGELSINQCRSG